MIWPDARTPRPMVREAHTQSLPLPRRRVRSAGYLLGAGLAGLLDGIVFHEILGWHHFVQSAGARSDGLFHALMWAFVLVAVAMLWRARARFAEPAAGRVLVGSALVGAGALQALDGLVDHLLLQLHWLHPQGNVAAWEAAYQVASWGLVVTGAWLMRSATRAREGAAGRTRARRAFRG